MLTQFWKGSKQATIYLSTFVPFTHFAPACHLVSLTCCSYCNHLEFTSFLHLYYWLLFLQQSVTSLLSLLLSHKTIWSYCIQSYSSTNLKQSCNVHQKRNSIYRVLAKSVILASDVETTRIYSIQKYPRQQRDSMIWLSHYSVELKITKISLY